jgi:hypothetical protein
MESVQDYARDRVVEELKKKLDTELGIKKLKFQPFNSVSLDSVYLYGRDDKKILLANQMSVNLDLIHLLQNKLVITSARISDFDINLSKPTPKDSLNIQFIIDAFKPKDQSSSSKLEVKLNSISLVNGNVNYDVEDQTQKKGRFDANHIHASRINARLSLKSIQSDSLNIQIKKLNLREQSGLEIKNLTTRLITQGKKASLRGFRLDLPSSYLKIDKFEADLDSISNYAFDFEIAPSYIAPKDLSAFVPELRNFNDLLTLYAHIDGSIDDINISEISLNYGEDMKLRASGEIKDIRDKENLYLLGSIDNFTINKNGIEGLINNFSETKKILPSYINEAGIISFEGDLSGYLTQLTAFGSLTSDIGDIKTDVLFGFNPKKGIKSYLEGKLYANNVNLGKLFNNNKLDETSLSLSIHYTEPQYGSPHGHMDGTIHKFDYKGYSYKDITIDTDYDGLKMDGMIDINDPNGSLKLKGLIDLSDKEKPVLDFEARARNIQLDSLRLVDNMKQSYLSFNINANFSGKNIDESDGYIKIDSLDFIREDKVFQMDKFLLETSGISTDRKLSIKSDIINGEILGAYSTTTIVNSIKKTFLPYLSILEPEENGKKEKEQDIKENNLTFNFQISNTESLSKIFNLPVTILSTAKLIGFYNNNTDKFKLEIFAPSLDAAGKNIKSGYILVENPQDEVKAKIDGSIAGKNNINTQLAINSSLANNNIDATVAFENNSPKKAKGTFTFHTSLSKNEDKKTEIDINILPSELLLNGLSWKMNESNIHIYGDQTIGVKDLYAYSSDDNQSIRINGKYSARNATDILKTELKNIELEYVFQTLAIDVLKFGGRTTGNVFLSTIEGKPYANTRIDVEDFSFNGTDLGHLNLFSEFDDDTRRVIMDGTILSKENKKTSVDGYVDPINQQLHIGFDADSIDISFLGLYAATLFDKVQGRGSGKVLLTGNFSKVTVEGKAYIEEGQIGINFLNTVYTFTDTVYLNKDLIYFNNVKFYDQNNNYAIGNGKVAHDYFADFMYFVDMTANNFMVYNATEKMNPIFFGKVIGSGNAEISGDEREVNIDVRMRTEDKTLVRMNFMEEEVNQYSFITYKNDLVTDTTSTDSKPIPKPIQSESGMGINMNFYVDATPDAVVELVMDPIGGDVIRGSGSGAMQFVWSTKTSPLLYGNFLINRGTYNFTFQKLLERKFTILDGSNVQFTGDPFSAELDVRGQYKLTANLNDLDKDIVRNSGQTNIPVNCILHLTGPLRHPNVNLDLSFPSADPEIERQIKNLLNTEDMINKQVAYLLLMSKFYTPSSANVENKTSDFAAVASATLSNQLSKLISQIDDRWQIGTNIRTSDSEFSNTEVELVLSSQLLNDRLIINGNFGYREDKNKATNQDAFIGDVDIEYLLNNSGTWRIKAYNHYNEKFYYTGTSVQTQGVGIMYKKDFDKIEELFAKKPKPVTQPADTIQPLSGDTLRSYIQIKK